MAILGVLSLALEIPDIARGVKFYTDAGLEAEVDGHRARFHCRGQARTCLELLGGAPRKRLHHVRLRAERLAAVRAAALAGGGTEIPPPEGFDSEGLWLRDPHGMCLHLVEAEPDSSLPRESAFAINSPGHIVRTRRPAILPKKAYDPVWPRRLGHVVAFTPDVDASIAFYTRCLGMGLADRAQDVIAFLCCRRDSDHHVVAFAKSPGVGFHHASFQVGDPDEVGRGGRRLQELTGKGDWGVGRHTIGSNFFHYIQDPWGSWFEYYSDMDFIDDHALWSPTNYDLEDSLANWGPAVPHDFVHNYEADS
jgi:catechol 2,3-dioxygenase-like lactoylglutathione lyase family enzyme